MYLCSRRKQIAPYFFAYSSQVPLVIHIGLASPSPPIIRNAVDDFIASMGQADSAPLVAHCKETMLPVIARGDLDDSQMDPTMIDVMNVVQLPAGYREKLESDRHNGKYSALGMIQAADRRRAASMAAVSSRSRSSLDRLLVRPATA